MQTIRQVVVVGQPAANSRCLGQSVKAVKAEPAVVLGN